MTRKHGQPKTPSLLPILAFLLLLLPACTPSTPVPPTSTQEPTATPIIPKPDPNRPELTFSPLELPKATVGQPYEVTITVAHNETPVGGMDITDRELPPGLALNYERNDDNAATIAGTPTKAGEFEFEIGAFCLGTYVNGQKGYQTYTLLVKQE